MQKVNVIGAGLAGSEATWQLVNRGIPVRLYEMRPVQNTPAHQTANFAELVCSNSLRADGLANAVGVMKAEMRLLNSLVISAADQTRVPAGGALAVDREGFSELITKTLHEHPLVEVINEAVTEIPEGPTIIATGPLTSPELSKALEDFFGQEYLYFYDAAAPIIERDSIDFDTVFIASRYDKGEAAYINCPMNEEEFNAFYDALVTAETVEPKDFEQAIFFEGCMPFEVMAKRGRQTLLYGPMKPVGLDDPRTGRWPYAVVQLRQDNAAASLYNIVGFQTHLKWPEQKRIIQMIPGLENASIVRYGVMHRNTFINAPTLLEPTYQTRKRADLFIAGQMSGVEGYVESAASGLIAGLNMASLIEAKHQVIFPQETVMGAQAYYITHTAPEDFQPMNANFGILPDLGFRVKKKEKKAAYAERAITVMEAFIKEGM
ncbi:methylenetetrahydrofolate--tRNA-(uracil(54)-C(5))-methyltransferase (FADH(2)-oxidizing) TrmFO [Culicoidibacter larvae]|uniref:Methylenetetrahydrofolate--tRNA-(uracil-5-)-methyltransferase TrmFO n=1 Tax=Culicoidibacter larvae TaxID=2579976 RepID=A0A5R8Q9H3_9FIRM|nr:methylenetetrahydrofolate--tRNA-(uracil(54)-C(5))-methyltransferase (FADH(2)-oxidizing) TrmFO [Culicoidibacter larvae]TLG72566.1 methylenetetrahydrofolate--tRNA-(uracil(54)-C(5))-methyltransferase (FADH(2)-oxidizing) TrmFO [Culicoidibacter larvae]